MARTLTFARSGQEFATAPVKLDRSKLYGRTETVALDAEGNVCELSLVDRSGTLLIPKGGTGIGMLDDDGRWIERSELVATDAGGTVLASQPSSFDAPIVLDRPATTEDLLDTTVNAVYQLSCEPGLAEVIGDQIYSFDYRYHAGPAGSDAFVLTSGDSVFMLVGQRTAREFLGLDSVVEELSEDEPEDLDDLDFGML